MRMVLSVAAVVALALGTTLGVSRAADEEVKPKHTIKDVMKKAHKEGLMKKIAAGQGTKEDAAQLVELYQALGQNKPPKGEPGSWKEKTGVILSAAKDVVDGKEGAGAALEKAANCGECHKVHKG